MLNNPDNWKREEVGREVKEGEACTTQFKTPYAGEWKVVGRLAGRYVHTRVKIAKAGEPIVFRSPSAGTLDYILAYLWDRTDGTPRLFWTPMDVHREAIEGRPRGGQ